MASLAPQAVTVTPRNPRSMSADRLAGLLRPQGIQAQAAPSLTEGLETARRLAGSNGIVLVAGSLYLAGEVRTALGLAESASGAI